MDIILPVKFSFVTQPKLYIKSISVHLFSFSEHEINANII